MDFIIQTSDGTNKKVSITCSQCTDVITIGKCYKHKDSKCLDFICKACFRVIRDRFYDYDDEADHGFRLVTKITQIKKMRIFRKKWRVGMNFEKSC